VVNQVLPAAPQKAVDTITGKFWVRVRVQVDPSGNVVGADFVSRGPSAYFANLALDAARNWRFAPRQDVQRRQGIVEFQFEHGSIKAMPVR
jgi:TonB family protein